MFIHLSLTEIIYYLTTNPIEWFVYANLNLPGMLLFFFLLSLPAVLSASLHPHLLVHNVVSFAFTPQSIRV